MPLLSTKQPVQKTFGPFVLTRDSQTKTQPILSKMETHNIRPRNLKSCVSISNPLPLPSLLITGSSYKMFRFNSSLHRLRGKQPPFSGCNKNNPIIDREFLQSPVLVPKKEGTYRPVIDLSRLNKFEENCHFQMENISCLKTLLKRGTS